MRLLIELCDKNHLNYSCDGLILALKDFSVESFCYYDIDEIKKIKEKYKKEIFVKINKNLFNDDIEKIKKILIELKTYVDGIFFYDLAILQLCMELKLNISLIWSQTHMVNNYKTCDYYYNKGVKYALLGKEITLDEIKEIIKKSKINCMVEVVSIPSVAHSYRSLITNYYKDLEKNANSSLIVREKVSNSFYKIIEDKNGTSFFLDDVVNGTSIIKDLYDCNCPYIIFREYGVDCFEELANDTIEYINNKCVDKFYVEKYKKIGNSTNFFFKKTIYKVK